MDTSSTSYPTTKNPLVLKYRGHVPAMKNRRQYRKDKKGNLIPAGKNKTVKTWLQRIETPLIKQWIGSGYSMMKNVPVAAWVDIYFYKKDATGFDLVTSDGDNAYTTIQETWQINNPDNDEAGIIGAVYDDRQIVNGTFTLTTTPIRALEGATAYLWGVSLEKPYYLQLAEFLVWYHQHRNREVEFVEIPDLLKELLDTDTSL